MRALAEYVMRGRTEAVIAAVLATGTVFFSWLGAAVIALVTLRKGFSQGSRVLLWAMVPAVALAALGNLEIILTLVGVILAAAVLRGTMSWSSSMVIVVIWGVLAGVLLLYVGEGYVAQSKAAVDEMIQQLRTMLGQMASQQGVTDVPKIAMPTTQAVAGIMVLESCIRAVLCLLLARWWQAMLYNPGGFREEFHRLRLSPGVTIGLLVFGAVAVYLGNGYETWVLIFALPLVIAGFGLVHGLAARKGLGGVWLGLFYFFWVLVGPVRLLVIALAVLDSWLDFRTRVAGVDNSN